MRTSTAAWTAALAVMSMQGPFTKAEAAPARNQGERPKYYFPKEAKRDRAFSNTTETTVRGPQPASPTSTTAMLAEPSLPLVADEPSSAPVVEPSAPAVEAAPTSSSAPWIPKFDPSAWLASMMGVGAVGEPTDSVITSTFTKTWQDPRPATQTYTITWTETVSSTTSSSSVAALTSSSSVPAPSVYEPSIVVPPTSSPSSSNLEPEPTTPGSAEPVVEPTSSSSSEAAAPPSSTSTNPSTSSPPVVVEPTPPKISADESPSAYSPTEIVQPTTRTRTKKHKQSPSIQSLTDVVESTVVVESTEIVESPHVEPTSTAHTRTHGRPSGHLPTDDLPMPIVQPTPYTPKTTTTSTESVVEEPTLDTPDIPSSSSYAIISSRSFSVPSNATSYMPTAYSSSSASASSSSLLPSSSSSSEALTVGLPSSLSLPSSILQPTIPRSEKLSSSTEVDHSPSRHQPGRLGHPTGDSQHGRPDDSTDGTSLGLLDSIVLPTPKSSSKRSSVKEETTSASAPSSGSLPTSIVLPTPHSSERTGQTGEHTRDDGELTKSSADHTRPLGGNPQQTGWPFDEPLLSGGLLPHNEPSPTRSSSKSFLDPSSSSSSTEPIIVPLPTTDGTSTDSSTRTQNGNPFASLGLTGLPSSLGLPSPTSASQPSGSDEEGEGSGHQNGEHGEGQHGQESGRPDFNPFSGLGITGLPTSLGQPTGVLPSGLPIGTGANGSNTNKPGRPDLGPVRPGQSNSETELGLTGLPSLPLSVPTTLPLEPSANDTTAILPAPVTSDASTTGANESAASETNMAGILPITIPSDASPTGANDSGASETGISDILPITTPSDASATGANDSDVSETGLGGILPTTANSATLPQLSGAITSVASEVTSDIGSVWTTDGGSTPTPSADSTTTTPPALASIASSLSDQFSSIVATATNPEVSNSLASEYSSVLSSAASSIESEASVTSVTPEETTAVAQIPGTTPDSPGTTVGTPAPTPGADTTTPSYTLSTSTGADGTTAIPVPNTTPTSTTPTTEQLSSSANTPSETYESQTAPSEGSTISTSIPLGTGATVPVASSGTSSASSDTSAQPSDDSSPSVSQSPETTPESTPVTTLESTQAFSPNVTVPSTPESTPLTTTKQTSIEPTGTNTATDYTLPTSWHFAPTGTTTATETTDTLAVASSSTGSSAFGIPTYMPRLIQPPGGMPAPPSNATLIQLGLNYGLNFPFVVREQDSASQIFAYLPQGIAYGLGISHDKVQMNALMPYDTSNSLQFITTLAQAYVPADLVDQLELDLHTPMSSVYSNPDDMIRTLMNMINPTIPILPGASMEGEDTASTDNPAATGGPSSNQGAPIGGDTGESRPVRGSSVGIGVGAVCGAAAYAAAMVYVARRYKKKRQGHQRASSVPTAGEMTENGGGMGGFFMSGGRGSSAVGSNGSGSRYSGHSSNGRSVREQGISAPVMSENSLGWN